MTLQRTSWVGSFLMHAMPIGFFLFFTQKPRVLHEIIPFEMIETQPTPAPAPLVEKVTPQASTPIKRLSNTLPQPTTSEPPKKVFGVSDRALRDDSPSTSDSAPGVSIGTGNTLETESTKTTDKPSNAPVMPIPVAEYLVDQMAVPTREITIAYPSAAREKNLQGPVIMELLVDEQGNVRDAVLLSGPGEPLNSAALTAAKKIPFKPARQEKKPVAVRVRYTYNFSLETS